MFEILDVTRDQVISFKADIRHFPPVERERAVAWIRED